jgi:hypothetical protein
MAQHKDEVRKRAAIKNARTIPPQDWEDMFYPQLEDYADDATAKAIKRQQVTRERQIWSRSLLVLVIVLNAFSIGVVIAIGMHKLQYNTSWAVPAVIAANFAETWALTKIAMKFWFDNNADA